MTALPGPAFPHEAGHAVVARVYGAVLRKVWAAPRGHGGADYDRHLTDELQAKLDLRAVMAGAAAEVLATGTFSVADCQEDFHYADEIVRQLELNFGDPPAQTWGSAIADLKAILVSPQAKDAIATVAEELARANGHFLQGVYAAAIIDPIVAGFVPPVL